MHRSPDHADSRQQDLIIDVVASSGVILISVTGCQNFLNRHAMDDCVMLAIWLENNRLSLRNDLPRPQAGPGQAVVRVDLAGICGTDLELVKGYTGFTGVPGHEFVGRVVQAPDRPELEGRRVVAEINIACGHCHQCRSGRERHCLHRQVTGIRGANGAFGEYLKLPVTNLVTLPRSVRQRQAVLAEPLAAVLRIGHQVEIEAGMRILVIGAGPMGQLIARWLQALGNRPVVVARYPGQRGLLADRGIDWCAEDDLKPFRWWDLVIEATGRPEGFSLARRAVRAGATIVVKSTYEASLDLSLAELVVDEITLVGSRCGSLEEAVRWLASDRIRLDGLVEAEYRLTDFQKAFEHASRPGALKVVLHP